MKEYRLIAWPELAHPFDRTAYRRLLNDMSHRFVTFSQLAETSGLRRHEVRQFIDMLEAHGMLIQRECAAAATSMFGSLGSLGVWLKRTISPAPTRR